MFRLSTLLLVGSGAAAYTDDETSLMQGLKPVQEVKHRQVDTTALTNLLESAKGMLKNGETSEVVAFATATLETIRNETLPRIHDATTVEQGLIDDHFDFFRQARVALKTNCDGINELQKDQCHCDHGHNHCRSEEEQTCSLKLTCDYDLYDLWLEFQTRESTLRQKEIAIGAPGHFCVEDDAGAYIANGTLYDFRVTAKTLMEEFQQAWPPVQDAETAYNAKRPDCQTKYENDDERHSWCNAVQGTLEKKSCDHAKAVHEHRATFFCAWENARATYDRTEKEARLMMNDRIREVHALKTIECLLERTAERNGRPCDENTGEVEHEMAACEGVRRTTDIQNLTLNFPCETRQCADGSIGIGPHIDFSENGALATLPGCDGDLTCPQPVWECDHMVDYTTDGGVTCGDGSLTTAEQGCSAISNCEGPTGSPYPQCVPPVPTLPCTAGEEYPIDFSWVPRPEFYWRSAQDRNSHCNDPPECDACTLEPVPECAITEWVWGGSGTSIHPVTSVRGAHNALD